MVTEGKSNDSNNNKNDEVVCTKINVTVQLLSLIEKLPNAGVIQVNCKTFCYQMLSLSALSVVF